MLGTTALGQTYLGGEANLNAPTPPPPPVVGARPGHIQSTDPGHIVRVDTRLQ